MSLVILLTVCQTVLGMLVGESGIRSTYNPLIDIYLFSSLVCLILYWDYKGEILSWSLMGIKGLNVGFHDAVNVSINPLHLVSVCKFSVLF